MPTVRDDAGTDPGVRPALACCPAWFAAAGPVRRAAPAVACSGGSVGCVCPNCRRSGPACWRVGSPASGLAPDRDVTRAPAPVRAPEPPLCAGSSRHATSASTSAASSPFSRRPGRRRACAPARLRASSSRPSAIASRRRPVGAPGSRSSSSAVVTPAPSPRSRSSMRAATAGVVRCAIPGIRQSSPIAIAGSSQGPAPARPLATATSSSAHAASRPTIAARRAMATTRRRSIAACQRAMPLAIDRTAAACRGRDGPMIATSRASATSQRAASDRGESWGRPGRLRTIGMVAPLRAPPRAS